ncbi:hypothetical protein EB796_017065 [Bugula neritina]|uniref:Uncharacterized protein n=1 Tax=Bugula neritina TaxID=10212 RepID=A0A7J7JG84_BUGNE|nr:hypothetical protein EB796_017065 [Bugula neritina]
MNQIQSCNQSGGIEDNLVECDQNDVEFVSEKQADYGDMNSSACDHNTHQVTIIQNSTESDSDVEVVLDNSKEEQSMSVIQDSDDIVELYESVRDDNSDITW